MVLTIPPTLKTLETCLSRRRGNVIRGFPEAIGRGLDWEVRVSGDAVGSAAPFEGSSGAGGESWEIARRWSLLQLQLAGVPERRSLRVRVCDPDQAQPHFPHLPQGRHAQKPLKPLPGPPLALRVWAPCRSPRGPWTQDLAESGEGWGSWVPTHVTGVIGRRGPGVWAPPASAR